MTLMAIALLGCSSDDETTIAVHAASSLETALSEIAEGFTANTGTEIELVFAGSASLASGIVEGREADVFASANSTVMRRVVAADLVDVAPETFTRNRLALVVPSHDPADLLTSLDALGSAAVALCAAEVPCGQLAIEAIDLLGLNIDPITEESNVSAVLAKVELGEVDAGFVYQSDLRRSSVREIPLLEVGAITNEYQVVVLRNAEPAPAAQAFVEYLTSPAAQQVFESLGFEPL